MSQTFDNEQTSNSLTRKEKYLISSTIAILFLIVGIVSFMIEMLAIEIRTYSYTLFFLITIFFAMVAVKNYSAE